MAQEKLRWKNEKACRNNPQEVNLNLLVKMRKMPITLHSVQQRKEIVAKQNTT